MLQQFRPVLSLLQSPSYLFTTNTIRQIGKDATNDEMFVSWNGPEMGESDEMLKNALELHFSWGNCAKNL